MNPVTLSSVYVASKSSGKPAKSLFVAVVLFVMGVSASAAPKPSVAELAAITERGQMLAEYDTAAWKATDALMVAHPKRLLRSAILFECDGPVHVPRLGCERRAGIPIPGICSILSSHGRGATMKTLGNQGNQGKSGDMIRIHRNFSSSGGWPMGGNQGNQGKSGDMIRIHRNFSSSGGCPRACPELAEGSLAFGDRGWKAGGPLILVSQSWRNGIINPKKSSPVLPIITSNRRTLKS